MGYYLGIDLGGTNIAAGLVDRSCNILLRDSLRTNAPRPPESLCDDMATLCKGLMAQAGLSPGDVESIGIGTPGIISGGTVSFANNLDLHNAPLAQLLSRRMELPVFLGNDASIAAYGEWVAGAGKNCASLLVITIGTGIGAGLVLDGRIYEGFNGAAPELGHIVLYPEGRICSCGTKGCFEAYCSARGLQLTTRLAMCSHPESVMWQQVEGDIQRVGGKLAFQAARLGDPTAMEVVNAYLKDLAVGVANAINLFQPEMLCIGGGVSKEGDRLILPLRERVKQISFAGRDNLRTTIAAAQLGDDAGVIGAAMLGTSCSAHSLSHADA